MRRVAKVLVSLLLLAATGILFVHALQECGDNGLGVRLGPPGPILAASSGRRQFEAYGRGGRFQLDGAPPPTSLLRSPSHLELDPQSLEPGLHTLAWEQRFMGQAPRSVRFGFLAGPFEQAGAPVSCALQAKLRPALFRRFVPRIEATLRSTFQRLQSMEGLPKIASLELHPSLVPGGLDLRLRLAFADRSILRVLLPLKFQQTQGAPLQAALRGELQVDLSGGLGTLAALKGGGLLKALSSILEDPKRGLAGALAAAHRAGNDSVRTALQEQLHAALLELNQTLAKLLPASFELGDSDFKLRLTLSPCGQPRVHAGADLVFRYNVAVVAVNRAGALLPPVAASLPGPARRLPPKHSKRLAKPNQQSNKGLRSPSALSSPGGSSPSPGPAAVSAKRDLTLSLTPALLDAVVDASWRSGALQALVNEEDMLRRSNARLAGRVTVRLKKIQLILPPRLELREGEAQIQGAEVKISMIDQGEAEAELMLQGRAQLRARLDGQQLVVEAQARALEGSCRSLQATSELRHPCYLSLLSALRQRLLGEGMQDSNTSPGYLQLRLARTLHQPQFTLKLTQLGLRPDGLRLGLQLGLPQ